MRLMIKQRAWNAFLQATRTFVHPAFDHLGTQPEEPARVREPDEDAPEPPKPDESGHVHPRSPSGFPPGFIDKTSFSIPEGFIIKKPVYLYLNIDGEDGRYWEIPLPAGTQMHITAERKPGFLVSHPVDRFDDDPTYNDEDTES